MPLSLINETWTRLITRKRNPLSEAEASMIDPIIVSFLKHEVDRYRKKLYASVEAKAGHLHLKIHHAHITWRMTQNLKILTPCS